MDSNGFNLNFPTKIEKIFSVSSMFIHSLSYIELDSQTGITFHLVARQ